MCNDVVVGVGRGTKKLSEFLDCTKVPDNERVFANTEHSIWNRNTARLAFSDVKPIPMIVRVLVFVPHHGSILPENKSNRLLLSSPEK